MSVHVFRVKRAGEHPLFAQFQIQELKAVLDTSCWDYCMAHRHCRLLPVYVLCGSVWRAEQF